VKRKKGALHFLWWSFHWATPFYMGGFCLSTRFQFLLIKQKAKKQNSAAWGNIIFESLLLCSEYIWVVLGLKIKSVVKYTVECFLFGSCCCCGWVGLVWLVDNTRLSSSSPCDYQNTNTNQKEKREKTKQKPCILFVFTLKYTYFVVLCEGKYMCKCQMYSGVCLSVLTFPC